MFNFFKKKTRPPENISEVLTELKKISANIQTLAVKLEKLEERSKGFTQKIGIIRFNPFSEVGGDQSFSVAFLDGDDSGVVITSLYSREENRVYAKPIKAGQSIYPLSEEEKRAIAIAQNWEAQT